jgi:lactate permease
VSPRQVTKSANRIAGSFPDGAPVIGFQPAGHSREGRGFSPTLLAAGNSSRGLLGKMISPQNLAIGAGAVGLAGRKGDLFRKVVVWSLVLVLLMCVIVYLQSTPVLKWMVV